MSFFYHDLSFSITWHKLLEDISCTRQYNRYCFETNYYEVFKRIIISILIDREIVLLDGDYTESELKRICGYDGFEQFNENLNYNSKDELISKLSHSAFQWRVSIFTSGTTGLPKKVTHTFESITRFVKTAPGFENDVWGFAYNPTHMAGLQVFFQALLNGNTIVRLFGLGTRESNSHLLPIASCRKLPIPKRKANYLRW